MGPGRVPSPSGKVGRHGLLSGPLTLLPRCPHRFQRGPPILAVAGPKPASFQQTCPYPKGCPALFILKISTSPFGTRLQGDSQLTFKMQ